MSLQKFQKKDRSSFRYWFAHLCAFNMVACLLGHWKFKYLFHDWEKPWLMILWRGDYQRVQKWHRTHRKHHLEYRKGIEKIDWEAWAIDNECSRFTKEASPLTCADWLNNAINGGKIGLETMKKAMRALVALNLKSYTQQDIYRLGRKAAGGPDTFTI